MTMIRPRSDVVYGIYRGLPSGLSPFSTECRTTLISQKLYELEVCVRLMFCRFFLDKDLNSLNPKFQEDLSNNKNIKALFEECLSVHENRK